MFLSLEEVAAGMSSRQPRRTYEPVRRNSRTAGRCEGHFWQRTDRQQVRKIVLAARRYELAGRAPGFRNGPLGPVALEVVELMANLVDYRSGRLDPSIDYLMRKLKRSRDAIVRALQALRRHGFLDWLRRYEPTGNAGQGPQVKQASNAYKLSLPARAMQLMGRMFSPPPLPDDFSCRQAGIAAEVEAIRADMTELERTVLDVDPDCPIGAALLRMAKTRAAGKGRESAKQTESLSGFIK